MFHGKKNIKTEGGKGERKELLTNSAGEDEAEEETAAETLHCSYFAVVAVCPELRDGLESGKGSLLSLSCQERREYTLQERRPLQGFPRSRESEVKKGSEWEWDGGAQRNSYCRR